MVNVPFIDVVAVCDLPLNFLHQNRFSKENQDKIHPMAWLPFGAGPRICIGLRLAVVEMKFALIRILQKYEFKTCPDTEVSLLFSYLSIINLKFRN